LAVIIPAKAAKRANITEGVPIRARVSIGIPEPFGLLSGRAKGSFDGRMEGLWRDRL